MLRTGIKLFSQGYHFDMGYRTGFVWGVFALLAAALPASAQTLSNQSLSGKYFFRHVSLGLDASGNLNDPRSLLGTMTFNGNVNGTYSYVGQQVIGAGVMPLAFQSAWR